MATRTVGLWRHSLHVKLSASLAAIQVVSVTAALAGAGLYLDRFFRSTAEAETAQLGAMVKAALRQDMLRAPDLALDRTVADLNQAGGIRRLWILDRSGRVAHAADPAAIGRVFDKNRDGLCTACHAAASPLRTRTFFTTDERGTPFIRHVDVIANEEACWGCHDRRIRSNGVILLEETTEAFSSARATVQRRLAATGTATLALMIALTALVTTTIVVRPIRRLTFGAQQVGAGNLEVRVPVRGRDEVAELGTAFNRMAADLGRSIDEIESKTAELSVVYAVLERVTRSIDLAELKDIVLQTHLEVLGADRAVLLSRSANGAEIEVLSRTADSTRPAFARFAAESDARLPESFEHAPVGEWFRRELSGPRVSSDRRLAALPIGTAAQPLALLVVARAQPFTDAGVNLKLLGVVAEHVAVAFEHARLYTLAITDDLTQLHSVRHFADRLEAAVERHAGGGPRFGLLMIDLDHFKLINDRWGHPAGDRVLAETARVIRRAIRVSDSAYRYGGEELAVLLPDATLDTCRQVAERIRQSIEAIEIPWNGTPAIRVTASIGAAVYPDHARSGPDLVAVADAAMYGAKRAGRNRVCGPPAETL